MSKTITLDINIENVINNIQSHHIDLMTNAAVNKDFADYQHHANCVERSQNTVQSAIGKLVRNFSKCDVNIRADKDNIYADYLSQETGECRFFVAAVYDYRKGEFTYNS